MTSLSEISSDVGDLKDDSVDRRNARDIVNVEIFFITGVLDELRVSFSSNHQRNSSFRKILLAKESPLLEFRALGGQVELSIRGNDMFIGTILKSLELEDQYSYEGMAFPRYLARSLIEMDNYTGSNMNQNDDDDNFFEASDNLVDVVDSPVKLPRSTSDYFSASSSLPSDKSIKFLSFSRMAGLLPDVEQSLAGGEDTRIPDTLDTFVKAQIVFYSQDSPSYNNTDKQVTVALATLSFFCYRPTILAIMEFANAINIENGNDNASEDKPAASNIERETSRTNLMDTNSAFLQESIVKGLLGKGKSRVMFHLSLNMTRALIVLMNENGSRLATLSQNDLLTDIKLDFCSFSSDDEDFRGYDYSLDGQLSEVRIVYLNRFVQEVVSYFMGLVPRDSMSVVKLKDHVTNSEKWFPASEIEGSPALKLDLSLKKPIILLPRRTDSLDYLELDVLHITVQNKFQWLGGDKNEIGAVHFEILTLQIWSICVTFLVRVVYGPKGKDSRGLIARHIGKLCPYLE
ncbi:hypothetical protein ACLOJK_034053 [Asimina triloba]